MKKKERDRFQVQVAGQTQRLADQAQTLCDVRADRDDAEAATEQLRQELATLKADQEKREASTDKWRLSVIRALSA